MLRSSRGEETKKGTQNPSPSIPSVTEEALNSAAKARLCQIETAIGQGRGSSSPNSRLT